jgi:hypothetical protein
VLLTGPFGGLTDDVREFLDVPDAAQLGFVFAAWWEGVDRGDWAPQAELGRLLWHERDTLLQELAGLPPGQVELAGFARRFRVLVGHRWPSMLAAADQADWRQALRPRPSPPGHAGRPGRPRPHVALPGLVRPHRHRPGPARRGRRHVRAGGPVVAGRRVPELSLGPGYSTRRSGVRMLPPIARP